MNLYRGCGGIKKGEEFSGRKEEVFEFYKISNWVYSGDNFYGEDIELGNGRIMRYKGELYNLKGWVK